jgi:biopolymer transport protein ExbD
VTHTKHQGAGMTPEEREAWEAKRQENKFRRLRRKAREAAGEIEELNITPMLDMMTIILVFLLKTYNASALAVTINNDLTPPMSSTRIDPAETATVTITASEVVVGEKTAVQLKSYEVPPGATKPDAPLVITPVLDLLKKAAADQKYIAKYNKKDKDVQFDGQLSVIGDRNVPYRLLLSVLTTAGQAEFSKFRFVVLKQGQ